MVVSTLIRVAVVASLLAPTTALSAPDDVDRAVCAVCGPREGAGFEVIEARATYRGADYAFCSVKCKVEFLRNPAEFLVSEAGTEAPPFSLPDLEGSTKTSLASLRGRVVLLDFWATFCSPCVAALPGLQDLHASKQAVGLTIVGLLVDGKPELAAKLAGKAGVRYSLLRANPEVWNAYRVNALPALVLVGRDGRIRRRFGGESDPGALELEVARALAEPAP
jgi:peroxiredoxin